MRRKIVPDVVESQRLVTIPPTASVRDAVRIMAAGQVGAIIVTREGVLDGIFTERDLAVRVVAEGLDPDRTPVGDVMSRDIETVGPGDSAHQALQKMVRRGCRHLPIIEDGVPVGMVSVRDLYGSVLKELEDDIRELDAYVHGSGYVVSP